MALTITEQNLTVSTTELSLITGTSTLTPQTTEGTLQVLIDGIAAGVLKGERFRVKVYEKVRAADTMRLIYSDDIYNVPSGTWVSVPFIVAKGWQVTMTKIAGTDRTFPTSVRLIPA